MDRELVYSTRGDLDNKAKAILDAANGVVFIDDSLVVELSVKRMYDEGEGFQMIVQRAGLSVLEMEQIGSVEKWTRRF